MNFYRRKTAFICCLSALPLFMLSGVTFAQAGIPAITLTSGEAGEQTWSLSIQALVLMTALTLLPAGLLLMTSFTRIIIVLSILRTALGTVQTPSNQILIGLSLFLTLFVMHPIFSQVYAEAAKPYIDNTISAETALEKAELPFRNFMLRQTRATDLELFLDISGAEDSVAEEEVSFFVLMPAFVTSELKTAFQIGFLLFIPFLIIDLVVASVLMSMGMMMLSPLIISLPFKLMLFVLIDGWSLTMGTLAGSFYLS